MTGRTCLAVILAAGLGTRMKSDRPKVMHEVAHLALVGHVARSVVEAGADQIAVVVGPQMPELEELVRDLAPEASCFVQTERLGTGHALRSAEAAYRSGVDDVVVLLGDSPLVRSETISRVRARLADGADMVVLGFSAKDPFGYGRLLTNGESLVAIREEKDASREERLETFCNSGLMAFRGDQIAKIVNEIGNDNVKGEFYLTDAVEIANRLGLSVVVESTDEEEVQGINTQAQLSQVEAAFQRRARARAIEEGVTLLAPDTVFFSYDTKISPGAIVEQNVVFAPGVEIASGARIRAFSHLEGARVSAGATVGPYARLRPGACIGESGHVGNFVEIKNAQVGAGAKVNHLSYIGDAQVGDKSNIGAGTITCNYDGFLKHQTNIGAGSFIGSNSTLVAPVFLGQGSYVAAGSVVTQDAPEESLVIGRARQATKEGRGAQLRQRLEEAAKNAKK